SYPLRARLDTRPVRRGTSAFLGAPARHRDCTAAGIPRCACCFTQASEKAHMNETLQVGVRGLIFAFLCPPVLGCGETPTETVSPEASVGQECAQEGRSCEAGPSSSSPSGDGGQAGSSDGCCSGSDGGSSRDSGNSDNRGDADNGGNCG